MMNAPADTSSARAPVVLPRSLAERTVETLADSVELLDRMEAKLAVQTARAQLLAAENDRLRGLAVVGLVLCVGAVLWALGRLAAWVGGAS